VSGDFRNGCPLSAEYVFAGKENVEIYLKYGLEVKGLQILIFSNHIPDFPMKQAFKN